MKFAVHIILFFSLIVHSKAQNNYEEAIISGDSLLKIDSFKLAIDKYFAAEAFDPTKKQIVQQRINNVFDKIEKLRRDAEDTRNQAIREREKAVRAEENARNQERLTQNLLLELRGEQEYTKRLLAQTELEKQKADSAFSQADKLIEAFYFYENKFTIAFKDDRFYFINKKGDEIRKLGRWTLAERFDQFGLSKVKDEFDTDYLLDTAGTLYKLGYSIRQVELDKDIEALILKGIRLNAKVIASLKAPKLQLSKYNAFIFDSFN
ncbi:MAG: hypothetical protein AAFZ15_34530, partial [Bacteroidota bacterium]